MGGCMYIGTYEKMKVGVETTKNDLRKRQHYDNRIEGGKHWDRFLLDIKAFRGESARNFLIVEEEAEGGRDERTILSFYIVNA